MLKTLTRLCWIQKGMFSWSFTHPVSEYTAMYLLMFQYVLYVVGCGHCKALAPVYEEVAATFQNDDNVSYIILFSSLPPLENTLRSSFHPNFEETKGYSPGFFFRGPQKCVEKSNPSESKRNEKLNSTCFSCIAHLSTEL